MTNDIGLWLSGIGEETLLLIGIRPGQAVLDFGSGPGYYALPAARIVGDTGQVVAVERNPLAAIRACRRLSGCSAARVMRTDGRSKLAVDDKTIDVILALDVLLPYYFTGLDISRVIAEFFRVAKPGGMLAVYPSHVPIDGLHPAINAAGFHFEAEIETRLLHFRSLTTDGVYLFEKPTA